MINFSKLAKVCAFFIEVIILGLIPIWQIIEALIAHNHVTGGLIALPVILFWGTVIGLTSE